MDGRFTLIVKYPSLLDADLAWGSAVWVFLSSACMGDGADGHGGMYVFMYLVCSSSCPLEGV